MAHQWGPRPEDQQKIRQERPEAPAGPHSGKIQLSCTSEHAKTWDVQMRALYLCGRNEDAPQVYRRFLLYRRNRLWLCRYYETPICGQVRSASGECFWARLDSANALAAAVSLHRRQPYQQIAARRSNIPCRQSIARQLFAIGTLLILATHLQRIHLLLKSPLERAN